ncbi:MAG TPA: thiolase family protein [Chloroflexota bacterium]|nr:thiolase family protein [Chloroflexota bacterium]
MGEVLIVDAVRSPVGRRNGKLKDIHPVNLAAKVLRAAAERAGLPPARVDHILMGCVGQAGEQSLNIARNSALVADFPLDVPAVTLDFQCGSSQEAINVGTSLIRAGDADVVIAAGIESLTRVPLGSSARQGPGEPFPPELRARFNLVHQGLSAEMIASEWGLTREELDAYGLRSHRLAGQATEEGRFVREIVPIEVGADGEPELFSRDEGIRADTSLEKLATLEPSFKEGGLITAGSSSQISDGAAAVVLASEPAARELGLTARARVAATAAVGDDPVMMLTAPIPATRKLLKKAGLRLDEIDLIEINEAFASVVLAWARELEPDMDKVNVNGGAIALGHPVGASGARIMATLLHELERRGGRYGLQTMCCGGGLAPATLIERV